jgi:NhaP-type Na+/H+ or K+/H+ antiporter
MPARMIVWCVQVIIFAFSSYMLADSFGLSGIVSILFCGLVSAENCLSVV